MLLFFIPRDTSKCFDQGCHCTVGDAKGGCVKQFEFDEFEDTVLSLRLDKRTTRLGNIRSVASSHPKFFFQ